jgi:hypothetical protein
MSIGQIKRLGGGELAFILVPTAQPKVFQPQYGTVSNTPALKAKL